MAIGSNSAGLCREGMKLVASSASAMAANFEILALGVFWIHEVYARLGSFQMIVSRKDTNKIFTRRRLIRSEAANCTATKRRQPCRNVPSVESTPRVAEASSLTPTHDSRTWSLIGNLHYKLVILITTTVSCAYYKTT